MVVARGGGGAGVTALPGVAIAVALISALTTPDDTRVTIPNSDILKQRGFQRKLRRTGLSGGDGRFSPFLPSETDPTLAARIGYEVAYTSPFT